MRHELEPIVIALGRWAARSPARQAAAPIGTDAIVLALSALFDPSAAKGLEASYELRLGEDRFEVNVTHDGLVVRRGGAERPDAIIDTDPDTLRAILWRGRRLGEARRSGDLTIEGAARAAERFVALFPLPEPAAVAA